MRPLLRASCAAAIGLALASPAVAQQVGVDEFRLGVMSHDVYGGFIPYRADGWNFNQIEDVNFQILFTSPDMDAFRWIGSPRPSVGATFSTTGQESMAHLGLTWHVPVFETPFFLEGTFGAAVHNGELTGAIPPMRNLGCRVNFYEAASIGMNVGENVTAMLTYEHTSNAELCSHNDGLSNFGFRVGWKF